MKPHQFTSKIPTESETKGQSTRLIENWRSPWRAMEVSEKAKLQQKAAMLGIKRSIGGTSEWQFGGLPECLKDSEGQGGRPPADAEGVDAFRR